MFFIMLYTSTIVGGSFIDQDNEEKYYQYVLFVLGCAMTVQAWWIYLDRLAMFVIWCFKILMFPGVLCLVSHYKPLDW